MYRIGVDLGGTNIAVGIVNENYQILAKGSTPTRPGERPGEAIVDDMVALAARLLYENGLTFDDVEALGVASPGVVDFDRGVAVFAETMHFRNFPICRLLRAKTGIATVHAENDANAAAFGEAVAGAAKGTRSSVMITLGTGVGGGVIIDGKVYSGFHYAGAELGHMVIERGGARCSCGRAGCFEAYCSATALIRMTNEKIKACEDAGRKTIMPAVTGGRVSGRTAFAAAKKGDTAAKEVVDTYLSYLALGITNLVNIFRPEVLSIGGGVAGEGKNLLDPLLPIVKKEQYGGDFLPSTRIEIAKLGNDAGIIGAAFLGI